MKLIPVYLITAVTCISLIIHNDNKIKEIQNSDTSYNKNEYFVCDKDKECKMLAELIYFESRGESKHGQLAVAHVVMNRVNSKYWPNTIEQVITQDCKFSYRCDGSLKQGIKNRNAWIKATHIATNTIKGYNEDPTNGATHYVNYKKLKRIPRWTKVYPKIAQIDNHTFFKRG